MATNVIMPALGIAMETGKLLQWMKLEGESVTQGDILMVIETDKTTVEIEAPATGVLSHVTASPGDEIPVGQTIAQILAPGEAVAMATSTPNTPAVPGSAPETNAAVTVTASPLARRIAAENNVDLSQVKPAGERIEKADVLAFLAASHVQPTEGGTPVLASPKARQAATESGIALGSVKGSGPGGAVLYADVTAALAAVPVKATVPISSTPASPLPPAAGETIKPGTIWRIMAERTTQSWTNVPHFYLSRDVNAGRLGTWRERAQKRLNAKITYTDLLVRLVAAALREHPRVNAMWKDGMIHLNPQVNVGLAVAIDEGLVVPIVHNAGELSIAQIAAARAQLVDRAQNGKLKPEDITGGTFTISNLGMYGVDSFHAIVNPPQAAILAVGRIVPRVVPVNDLPAVQPMMTLTLSCDHRAVDGARGAQFLQTLAEMIEEPLGLLD